MRSAPKAIGSHSGRFGQRKPTRVPFPTPSATSLLGGEPAGRAQLGPGQARRHAIARRVAPRASRSGRARDRGVEEGARASPSALLAKRSRSGRSLARVASTTAPAASPGTPGCLPWRPATASPSRTPDRRASPPPRRWARRSMCQRSRLVSATATGAVCSAISRARACAAGTSSASGTTRDTRPHLERLAAPAPAAR